MPNYTSFTENLVRFVTKDFGARLNDAFDELTLMVWAEGTELSNSLAYIGIKYNINAPDLLNIKYIMELVDVIHAQECDYNMECVA